MSSSPKINVQDISPNQGRLLVAEDNAALRDYLVAVLRAEGYEVAEAASAEDLVDNLAVSLSPELGCGGFDLVIAEDRLVARGEGALRSGWWARVDMPPFVLLGDAVGRAGAGSRLTGQAVARFSKPLDMESLCSAVRSFSHTVDARMPKAAMANN